jgi:hypothetical protein
LIAAPAEKRPRTMDDDDDEEEEDWEGERVRRHALLPAVSSLRVLFVTRAQSL